MQSNMANRLSSLALGLICAATFATATAADMPKVEGEYAKPSAAAAKSAALLPLKGTLAMQSDFAAMELPAMAASKIEAIKKSNSVGGIKKSMQIGISRSMSDELPNVDATPTLRWKSAANGSKIAYVRIKSADAKAIRVGLNIANAPAG